MGMVVSFCLGVIRESIGGHPQTHVRGVPLHPLYPVYRARNLSRHSGEERRSVLSLNWSMLPMRRWEAMRCTRESVMVARMAWAKRSAKMTLKGRPKKGTTSVVRGSVMRRELCICAMYSY